MSWNKNTVVVSSVDATIKTLQTLQEPYDLNVLGYAVGHGLNDPDYTQYSIRRLAYKNVVLLEQMYRADDCDADDTLMSFEFTVVNEPNEWPTEVYEAVDQDDSTAKGGTYER